MMSHTFPVVLVFESDFFNVLADFVKARKGNGRALPCADICCTITSIVSNAAYASQLSFDNPWTTKNVLKQLEATGVLEQFIRCATVPQPHKDEDGALFHMLDLFQTCVPFISKKVRLGQPCGDVIIAILEGRDGSRVGRPRVLNKLKTIIRFAASIDPEYDPINHGSKICQTCNKVMDLSESLMKCYRCQHVYYCSKECQKADWKTHKKTCAPMTKRQLVELRGIRQTFLAFCERRYVHIMVKMVEACEQTGLSKNDMLVELDFSSNENGIVPAMQDKPEFNIAPVKDYIEGSRPAEPDWFGKNLDRKKYEENIKVYLAVIELGRSKLGPNEFLCFVNSGEGCFCQGISRREGAGKENFSQEAVLAFKAYMYDDDDGPLAEIVESRSLGFLKREVDYILGLGTV